MSKKSKQTVASIPTIYAGLDRDPEKLKILIVEDHSSNFSLFNERNQLESLQSFNSLIKDTIHKSWMGIEELEKENHATIAAYHDMLFSAEAPKDQDHLTTCIYVFHGMRRIAKCNFVTDTPVATSGRASSVLSSTYQSGATIEGTGTLKCPQAIACIKLFRSCLSEKQDADMRIAEAESRTLSDYVPVVTEAKLRKFVEDHAADLRTRQEPWRIFQYYRAQLIENKILVRK